MAMLGRDRSQHHGAPAGAKFIPEHSRSRAQHWLGLESVSSRSRCDAILLFGARSVIARPGPCAATGQPGRRRRFTFYNSNLQDHWEASRFGRRVLED